MRQKIEQQWQELNPREQKIGLIGGVILILLLYYLILYSPLSASVENHQRQIQSKTELLGWMQRASTQLKLAAEHNGDKKIPQGSVLSIAEQSIKQGRLSAGEIKQIDNNQVQIRFEKVSFDQLLAWLQKLPLQYRLRIFKINMKRTAEEGIITATVVVTK